MTQAVYISVFCFFAAAEACTIFPYFLKGEEKSPGVFRVLQGSGSHISPGWATGPFDTLPDSKVADFKDDLTAKITASQLVFIGVLDSVIEDLTHGQSPPVGPFPVPAMVLETEYPAAPPTSDFYLRLKIDTVLKGTLPSKDFWVKSNLLRTTCGENFTYLGKLRFLNYSDALDSLSDLKINYWAQLSCSNCPVANTFDGWHLRSPEFPVLRLDIREVFPEYPVSLRREFRQRLKGPGPDPDRAYRPDGRIAPNAPVGKSPVPVLR